MSLFPVQLLNVQKFAPILYMLSTPFYCCIDILPYGGFFNTHWARFLHSHFLVGLLPNPEFFIFLFPSVENLFDGNNIIQVQLHTLVGMIMHCRLLSASLNIRTEFLAEYRLLPIVRKVGIDWCTFGNIELY